MNLMTDMVQLSSADWLFKIFSRSYIPEAVFGYKIIHEFLKKGAGAGSGKNSCRSTEKITALLFSRSVFYCSAHLSILRGFFELVSIFKFIYMSAKRIRAWRLWLPELILFTSYFKNNSHSTVVNLLSVFSSNTELACWLELLLTR